MQHRSIWLIVGSTAIAMLGTYLGLRKRLHRWGASDDEVARSLPGDDIITQPHLMHTLAITIDAPPDHVWPWIVQLGQGRGGWYSYDWLENVLGLDIHTADRILPEFQQLQPGDVIPTGAVDIPVLAVDPPHLLLLGGAPFSTLAFVLEPQSDQRTRLIFRNRANVSHTPLGMFWFAALDPGIFIMSRKMLLTIKDRVEHGSDRARQAKQPHYNRFALRIAGHRGSPFAIVEHVGRRSGRMYRTPVEALPTGDGLIIALGHGATCDWCRNIMAAGTCTIIRNGARIHLYDPQVIDLAAALPLLSPFRRWLYTRSGAQEFLHLRHTAQSHHTPNLKPDPMELVSA